MHVIIHMKKIVRYDMFFKTQTCNLFVKKNLKNFCLLFKKILALKVMMLMCINVKDRVKRNRLFFLVFI